MNATKKNLLANYVGQIYIAVVGVAVMPLYLRYMGAEAYGLIGFFTLIQSWMYLFDLGMSPALGREVVLLRSDANKKWRIRVLLRSFESIFTALGALTVLIILLTKQFIVNDWLRFNELDPAEVSNAISFMAITIGFRWIATLHKSLINAYEKQVWLNAVEVILATARFPGALALVSIVSEPVYVDFFAFQLAISAVEALIVSRKTYALLPEREGKKVPFICLEELRRIAPFAASIAYGAGIWILISQFDKLILSKALTLGEYGYFTLVATVCTGISTLTAPISKVFLPRMTVLWAGHSRDAFVDLYRKGAHLVLVSVVPIVTSISLYPLEVIVVWTGNFEAAQWIKPILPLYAIGCGILALGSIQYWLQYANGNLRLHVWYNSVSALVTVPLVYFVVLKFGVIGAAWSWVLLRACTYVFWMPYVHRKFLKGFHLRWVLIDVMVPVLCCVGVEILVGEYIWNHAGSDRWAQMLKLGGVTLSGFVSIFLTNVIIIRGRWLFFRSAS